jgi:probable HAF family extracellular repeat protein
MVFRFTSRLLCGMSVAGFAVSLTTGSALAQCPLSSCATEWSNGGFITLPLLPGFIYSQAAGINDAGQVVGISTDAAGHVVATEWSNGQVINLPGAPYSAAGSINHAGQVVGFSPVGGDQTATEWSNGQVIYLPLPPGFLGGSVSIATGINDVGQVVGQSMSMHGGSQVATEWSNGQLIELGGLPGSTFSSANSINNAGQVVGVSAIGGGVIGGVFMSPVGVATEWSNGQVIELPILPGFTESFALGINDAGQVVGTSNDATGHVVATEWSNGQVINLPLLPGFMDNQALGINDAGQVVGVSSDGAGHSVATEWSNGQVINLGGPPGVAFGINDAGQVVGYSSGVVPEPSTWAMMLLGFGGLGFAGYRTKSRVNVRVV